MFRVMSVNRISNSGTNFKVGAPVERESRGHRFGAKRRNFFWWSPPPSLFGSKSTISRYDERFRDG